eukprot:CAMPEP_0184343956 /NCGR_PEP_ID=MMETSP1089-20130417/12473_1 /TAXON_ID=38269 ORGANISM="Gloeochaete wittrockiana, Strain SAG46.84" /NCGR_SAMPLE_ID=MMETSP1089 /ASSEMBLY_ACC=CAM_ASM_000445 /LENGTH=750 /DNA_ID=CAMNT_0026673531 /DNA_START=63 /DNA_END=2315 /DNA_ORIENTATION=+
MSKEFQKLALMGLGYAAAMALLGYYVSEGKPKKVIRAEEEARKAQQKQIMMARREAMMAAMKGTSGRRPGASPAESSSQSFGVGEGTAPSNENDSAFEMLFLKAKQYQDNKEYFLAGKTFHSALSFVPNAVWYLRVCSYAISAWAEGQFFDDALRTTEELLEYMDENDSSEDGELIGFAKTLRLNTLIRADRSDDVLAYITELENEELEKSGGERTEKFIRFLQMSAQILKKKKRYDEAIEKTTDMIELAKQFFADDERYLGYLILASLRIATGEREDAVADFKRDLKMCPLNDRVTFESELGRILIETRDFEFAKTYIDDLVDNPEIPHDIVANLHCFLISIFYETNELDLAKAYLDLHRANYRHVAFCSSYVKTKQAAILFKPTNDGGYIGKTRVQLTFNDNIPKDLFTGAFLLAHFESSETDDDFFSTEISEAVLSRGSIELESAPHKFYENRIYLVTLSFFADESKEKLLTTHVQTVKSDVDTSTIFTWSDIEARLGSQQERPRRFTTPRRPASLLSVSGAAAAAAAEASSSSSSSKDLVAEGKEIVSGVVEEEDFLKKEDEDEGRAALLRSSILADVDGEEEAKVENHIDLAAPPLIDPLEKAVVEALVEAVKVVDVPEVEAEPEFTPAEEKEIDAAVEAAIEAEIEKEEAVQKLIDAPKAEDDIVVDPSFGADDNDDDNDDEKEEDVSEPQSEVDVSGSVALEDQDETEIEPQTEAEKQAELEAELEADSEQQEDQEDNDATVE